MSSVKLGFLITKPIGWCVGYRVGCLCWEQFSEPCVLVQHFTSASFCGFSWTSGAPDLRATAGVTKQP